MGIGQESQNESEQLPARVAVDIENGCVLAHDGLTHTHFKRPRIDMDQPIISGDLSHILRILNTDL